MSMTYTTLESASKVANPSLSLYYIMAKDRVHSYTH